MKNYLMIVPLLLACGATDDLSEMPLGQTEEAMNAPETQHYVLGTSEGSGRVRCVVNNAQQTCDVPTTRVYKYCAETTVTQSQLNQLSTLDAAGSSSDRHFSWSPALDSSGHILYGAACDAALTNGTANVMVNAANNICASQSTGSANIDTFVCYNPTLDVALSKSPSNFPGNYQGIRGGIIHIDNAKLAQFFPSDPNKTLVLQHGLGHAAVGLDGLGARSESTSQFLYSYRPTFPISTLGLTKSAGEDCVLRFYTTLPQGVYGVDTSSCVGVTPE